jgi:hypothetical protein
MRQYIALRLAAVMLFWVAGASGAWAQAPGSAVQFQVVAASATSSTIDLPLASDEVRIPIMRSGGTPTSQFVAVVSNIQDAAGTALTGSISAPGGTSTDGSVSGVVGENGVTTLTLRVKPSPTTGPVTGVLSVSSGTTITTWRLNLSKGGKPTATLIVDNPVINRAVKCHWFWGCGVRQGEATVTVWDKQRTSPLNDVMVRLEQVLKPGTNFDGPLNLRTTFNGSDVDLWTPNRAGDAAPMVPIAGQGRIGFVIQNLRPGEYNATLRVLAANSVADDGQKITFAITARHSVVWALAVVVVGLIVSLIGTKWISAVGKRLAIESRISDLSAPWLRQEPPTAALVWTLANFKLILEAVRTSWFSIPDSVNTRLESAASVVPLLRSIHDIRTALSAAPTERNMPPFVVARAAGVLDSIVRKCSDPPLDASVVSSITEQLKGLGTWLGPSGWSAQYWADLAPALSSLVTDVRPQDIQDQAARNTVQALRDALAPHSAAGAAAPPNAVDVERQYAALRVLWERRNTAEFADLVKAHTTQTLEDVFRIADERAWQRLKEAVEKNEVAIELGTPNPQALEPFTLSVVPTDPAIGASYLFRHRLECTWIIERVAGLEEGATSTRSTKPFRLSQRTLEPMVSQYAPAPMTLKAFVTLRMVGSTVPPPKKIESQPFHIAASQSLGLFAAFSGLDLTTTAIIGAASTVSGLSTFYYASPSFGAPKDYIALLLWALAFDQAKNGIVQITTAKTT